MAEGHCTKKVEPVDSGWVVLWKEASGCECLCMLGSTASASTCAYGGFWGKFFTHVLVLFAVLALGLLDDISTSPLRLTAWRQPTKAFGRVLTVATSMLLAVLALGCWTVFLRVPRLLMFCVRPRRLLTDFHGFLCLRSEVPSACFGLRSPGR